MARPKKNISTPQNTIQHTAINAKPTKQPKPPTRSPSKYNSQHQLALRPHAGVKFNPNPEDFIKTIKLYRGFVNKIADHYGINRTVCQNLINNNDEFKDTLNAERERWVDEVEQSVLTRAIESNDTGLQCFVLKTRGKNRGYDQSYDADNAKNIATAAFEFVTNKTKNPVQ